MKKKVENVIIDVLNKMSKMGYLEREFLSIKCNGLRELAYSLVLSVTEGMEKTEELDKLDVLNSIDSLAREILENTIGDMYVKSASELLSNLNTLLYYIGKLEGMMHDTNNKTRKSK